ncbi:MAG: tetratricopeptide repeat protein [Gemmatimonadales bacterium]|nr:tetratricopeptide repeat protein [Gemmatimonadales bacterium]
MMGRWRKQEGHKQVGILLFLLLSAVLFVGPAATQVVGDHGGQPSDYPTDPIKAELQAEIESGSNLTPRGRKALFRARTHQDAGRFTEAVEILEKWQQGNPEREHHLLRFQQGMAYLGMQNPERALEVLQTAVKKEPRFARAWLRLGETAYGLESFDLAAEAFNQGYELSPTPRPEFLYYGCVAALSGGNSGRALDGLEHLLTLHRQNAPLDWYRALVTAATDAEQPDRAAPHLERARNDHAGDPEVWELAYRFSAGRGDYEAAAIYLTITGYLRELSRQERTRLGDLYAVINVPLQAARSYAAALDPEKFTDGNSRATEYERLAGAWLAAHRHEEARETLHRALAETETRRLWSLLGDLDHMSEDYAGALKAYGRGCELDPAFARGWLMMGYCCQELDRPDEARKYLNKAKSFPEQAASANILLAD